MSACDRCNGSGLVAVCVEPMAGLAGYESEPCGCDPVKRFPMLAPTVSPLEAAWAEFDAFDAPRTDLIDRLRALDEQALVAYKRAAKLGPRPAKVPT